jgi:hypothetical protein
MVALRIGLDSPSVFKAVFFLPARSHHFKFKLGMSAAEFTDDIAYERLSVAKQH